MRARPEGTTGIDDDRDRIRRRLLPGRPDPERPDPDRPVELAPPLLPAGLDRPRRDLREELPEPCLSVGVRVDGELAVGLFEAFRMELEEPGPRRLERLSRNRECDPPQLAQRNALFSFSKNPSSRR
ncbi:MAG TPA: hypothetical protein VGW30_08260 [Gaiellaceae bacterium]|nr:hypothetical protein [Gaiellaceae bacterium]